MPTSPLYWEANLLISEKVSVACLSTLLSWMFIMLIIRFVAIDSDSSLKFSRTLTILSIPKNWSLSVLIPSNKSFGIDPSTQLVFGVTFSSSSKVKTSIKNIPTNASVTIDWRVTNSEKQKNSRQDFTFFVINISFNFTAIKANIKQENPH